MLKSIIATKVWFGGNCIDSYYVDKCKFITTHNLQTSEYGYKFVEYGGYATFVFEGMLYLVCDQFWLLEQKVKLGLHFLPEMKLGKGKPIHFSWAVSGSDSSNYESVTYNCLIWKDGTKLDLAGAGTYDRFFGDRGRGISGSVICDKVEEPTFEEVCIAMRLRPEEITSYSGGDIDSWDKNVNLILQHIPDSVSVPCYGGSTTYSIFNDNSHVDLLLGNTKCQLRTFVTESYGDVEETSTFFWLFPNKTKWVALGQKRSYELLRQHGGTIPQWLEDAVKGYPTKGEGWAVIN